MSVKLNIIDKIQLAIHRKTLRRAKNLCAKCPDGVRGTCCYVGIHLREPDEYMCLNECTPFERSKCNFPVASIKKLKTGRIYNVILSKHPCKFLDLKTNLCTIYENRLKLNRACNTIEQGLKTGIWHSECMYVKKNKSYLQGIVKVHYKDVEDKLCQFQKDSFTLANETSHRVLYEKFY